MTTEKHFDGNKCSVCNSFMRKEGSEWKCSRCERQAYTSKVNEVRNDKVTFAKPTAEAITINEEKQMVKELEKASKLPDLTEAQIQKYAPKKIVEPKVATQNPKSVPKSVKVVETAVKSDEKKDKSEKIREKLDQTDFATLGSKKMAMGKVDEQSFLGYLLGYSIGERLIPHEDADRKLNALGMPDNIRPAKGRPRDCFKNANVLQEKEETFSSPTLAKKYGSKARFRAVYKADQVKPNEYIIDRKIFLIEEEQEGRTAKKSDIQFDRLARIMLVIENEGKPNESYHIEAEPMPQGDAKTAEYLKGVIKQDYRVLLKSYTSKQVRDALRKFIMDNDGIPFTTGRGGMWFMPKSQESNIKKWRQFCQWCDGQNGSDNRVDLRLMPALDLYDMKTNIARDVADEVQQRVKNLLEDTYAKLKGEKDEEKIEEVLARQLASKREDVDGLLTSYKKILKDEIEVTLKLDVVRHEKVEAHLSPKAKQMLREIMNV